MVAHQRGWVWGFYIMTIRELIHELLDKGELDTHVVIETANGDYNIATVGSQYVGDNTVYLCIDE